MRMLGCSGNSTAADSCNHGMIRSNKRSMNDLKLFAEDDDVTMSTLDDSEQFMALDEQGSSFLFGGNETAHCLQRELKRLPMAIQEKVGQDMVGIVADDGTTITPESFEVFETEIQQIPEKAAYDMAVKISPDYVQSNRFRLMFLRACQGDAKKAAKRITRHFSTKLNLFGSEKLVKDIELSDLDEYDMEALQSGGFQVLPKRDLAGRNVLFGRYTAMKYREIKNMLRALWYIWMSMLEDEVNQVKGVVAIGYELFRVPLQRFDHNNIAEDRDFEMFGAEGGFDRELAREIIRIPLSVPARPVGYHLCCDSHQWVGILEMIMVTLCKFVRLRMRIHNGSEQECKYALLTSGMPAECIPVDSCGDLDLTNHNEWIWERERLEELRRSTTDVLLVR